MTALDRARGWFVAPPDLPSDEPVWYAPPAADRAVATLPPRGDWQPPVADEALVEADAASPRVVAPAAAPGGPTMAENGCSPRVVTSAAVLGRAGEVEPVAAALALALRRETRAATASVAVIGAAVPDVAGGGGAARRLGARLEGQGFEVRVRGRLAWVRLDPADGQLAAAARRLTLVGAPAVLAVTAPRNAATDAALVECDLLVIVATEPEGPLARLAAASGLAGVRAVTVRPLGRAARALARAGISSTRPLRHLLSTEQEQQR